MDVLPSPQPCAVGEATVVRQNEFFKESYASKLCEQNSLEKPSNAISSQANRNDPSKLELCAVNFDQEHLVIKFSMEDINIFTREEGLHQAVVIKLSYGFPHVSEVRRNFASQFGVKGECNIGQLEFRHLLIRFDLFDDYAHFIGKSTGFLKSKGEEFFFRTFPWTFGFNPKEETSMAVVWISMPGLPPNLFARRSLLSIASAVGKSIAIDKATQDRTRPSTARVKVIINLLDKLPDLVKLHFVDSISGKSLEVEQIIVYDNIPSYCEFCKHQGHAERDCRYKSVSKTDYLASNPNGNERIVTKLQGDAREFLNKKRDAQVWKQKPMAEPLSGPSVMKGNGKEDSIQQVNQTVMPKSTTATGVTESVLNEKCTVSRQSKAKTVDEGTTDQMVNDSRDIPIQSNIQPVNSDSFPTNATLVELLSDLSNKSALNDGNSTTFSNFRNATEKGKNSMTPVSFKPISKSEFEVSLGSSSYNIGSISGSKYVHAQQNFSHLTGQDIICNAYSSNGHIIEKSPVATASLCPPIHNAYTWNNENLQGECVDDRSRRDVPFNEVSPEIIRDQASIPLKVLASKEDLDVRDPQQMIFPTVMTLQKNIMKLSEGMTKGHHHHLQSSEDIEQIGISKLDEQIAPIFDSSNTSSKSVQKIKNQLVAQNVSDSDLYPKQLEGKISQINDERLGEKSREVSTSDALLEPKHDNAQLVTVPLKPLSSNEDADPNNQVSEHLFMHNPEVHSSDELVSSFADQMDARIGSGKSHVPKDLGISDENHAELSSRSNHLETTDQLDRNYSISVDKIPEELQNVIVDPIQPRLSLSTNTLSQKNNVSSDSVYDAAEVPLNQNLAKPSQLVTGKDDDGQLNQKDGILSTCSEAAAQLEHTQGSERQSIFMQNQCATEEETTKCLMKNMEAHSHTNSIAKTAAHKSVTKHTPFISKRSKGAKLKVWNDQRDYDDEETWGDGLASFSWEEEDQEDDQEDSDDSVDQICQIKDANMNMHANVKQSASPKTSLNHNAPLFVPKKQRETNWDGRIGEDVLIRKLPMRHAKLKQTLQPSVLKPTRQRNKREI